MEMPREKYVNDLQLILTGEVQADQSYSFHLAPDQPGSSVLQLVYEKVRSNMSVSGMLWFYYNTLPQYVVLFVYCTILPDMPVITHEHMTFL